MNINFEINDGIGILTINRPKALNALNGDVFDEIKDCLEKNCKEKLKGLILTGSGEKAFIAGADIKAMVNLSRDEAQAFAQKGQQVTLMFEELRFPVIAAVNGFALGGGLEMALSADIILCSENAVFGLPEVSLGLIPGFGGTQRLAKIIGRMRAKDFLYSGSKIKAQQAKELGLVLEVYPTKDELISAAVEKLNRYSKNSSLAIGTAKYAVNSGVDLQTTEGLEIESINFGTLFESYDMKEGTSAFIEKRNPNFKGE